MGSNLTKTVFTHRISKDKILTIRFRGYLANIDLKGKTKSEIEDAIRWEMITAGLNYDSQLIDAVVKAALKRNKP